MNRNTRVVCEEYKAWVRARGCCVCLMPPPSDPDHLKARGLGSGKRNDFTCIPLCRKHHQERHSQRFKFGVDLWEVVSYQLIEFFADKDRRKNVKIEVSTK